MNRKKIFWPVFLLILGVVIISLFFPFVPEETYIRWRAGCFAKKGDVLGLKNYIEQGGLKAAIGISVLVGMDGDKAYDAILEELKSENKFFVIPILHNKYEYGNKTFFEKRRQEIINILIPYLDQKDTRLKTISFLSLIGDEDVIEQLQKVIADQKHNIVIKEAAQDIIIQIKEKNLTE